MEKRVWRYHKDVRVPRALLILLLSLFALLACSNQSIVFIQAALNPDQTFFLGSGTQQISAVKHSNAANWDMVAHEHPAVYLGAEPKECAFESKDDLIFSLTGIWIAQWTCHP